MFLAELPTNSSYSKPSVPSNNANDPSNKANDSFQLFDELKKPAEGFLNEAAGLHEAMSHLKPNVYKSNENDKNGGGVIDSLLSMKPESLQGLKGDKVHIQNTQQNNSTSDLIQPKESE